MRLSSFISIAILASFSTSVALGAGGPMAGKTVNVGVVADVTGSAAAFFGSACFAGSEEHPHMSRNGTKANRQRCRIAFQCSRQQRPARLKNVWISAAVSVGAED